MSQSDYIKRIKVSNELKSIKKLAPILNSGNYTDYVKYSIETKTANTKQVNSQLSLSNQPYIVYDIPIIDASGCPVFLTCNDTNQRTNRVLTPFSGYIDPIRPLTQKEQGKSIRKLDLCVCNF
jgi:hypothetical protein